MANIIVTSDGLTNILKMAGGVSGGLTEAYLEVGTGALTPSESITSLVSALSPRALLVNSVSGNILTLEAFFTNSQANNTLTEWAIWSAITSGTLLACGVFSPSITKTVSSTLTVTITETLSNG